MPAFQILVPHYYRWDFEKHTEAAYHEWHKAKQATEPEFKIENIRFAHDPNWRNKLFSIQSVHDGNHWVWRAARVMWCSGGGWMGW